MTRIIDKYSKLTNWIKRFVILFYPSRAFVGLFNIYFRKQETGLK